MHKSSNFPIILYEDETNTYISIEIKLSQKPLRIQNTELYKKVTGFVQEIPNKGITGM